MVNKNFNWCTTKKVDEDLAYIFKSPYNFQLSNTNLVELKNVFLKIILILKPINELKISSVSC